MRTKREPNPIMNGESTATPPTAVPPPTAEEPKQEGPKENLEAAMKAFMDCNQALTGLHPNDVKKTLQSLSIIHFGR